MPARRQTRRVLAGRAAAATLGVTVGGGATGLFTARAAGAAPFPQGSTARAPLGTNLDRIDDWGTELPFLDAFKMSRPWISGTASTWDDQRPLDLDAQGWVRALQPGQVARTLMFWSPAVRYPSGRYLVQYEGEGTLELSANARVVGPTPGQLAVQVDSSRGNSAPDGLGLTITATNPRNYVRNIQVRLPLGAPQSELFHPTFLERIATYGVIRFKDWQATDGDWTPETGSQQRRWDDRPRLADARWSGTHGVPLEVMIALANTLRINPWFCMPHQADDDYVRRFAQMVLATLDPSLTVYVEHSNEAFYLGYAQAYYAQRQGLALRLSQDPYEAQIRYHAKRSREIFGIWEQEFPSTRLVRVLGSDATNPWTTQTALSYADTAAHTDSLAVAPYFGFYEDDQPRVQRMNVDALFQELRTVVLPSVMDFVRQQAALAKQYGVRLVAYEAGQHLVTHGALEQDPALNALYDAANRDPRMGSLYTDYLRQWTDAGGDLLVHFLNCGAYGQPGRWGSLEYIEQPRSQAPKYDALQRWIEGR